MPSKIDLGNFDIKDPALIVDVRNKIRLLAADLGFGTVKATQLAVITSEMGRLLCGPESRSVMRVELLPVEAAPGGRLHYALVLAFEGQRDPLPVSLARPFFDRIEEKSLADGRRALRGWGLVPNPEFRPTAAFVEQAREKLARRTREELYREIDRRNRELQHLLETLKAKNKELNTATRLKSEFLANMSHELRTPLNSIIGFSGRIIKKAGDRLPDKQLKNLETVLRNAHHLLGLINDLLDLSKIEAGRMDIYPETFRLGDLIAEVLQLTGPLAAEKQLDLQADLPDRDMALYTDQTKLKQILINLVSNAVKFTAKGRVIIAASPANGRRRAADPVHRPAGDCITIRVSDTGIGLSPEETSYIFDAFRQVQGGFARQAGGTGLGLAISRRFVELLQGTIEVQSEKHRGTTFTLTLPVQIEVPPVAQKVAPPAAPRTPERPGGGLTVLCIDDNPEVLDLLREVLEDEGYKVVTALGGEEGLNQARALKPFAVTLDIQMPYVDGWTVIQKLKADRATRAIPVIMVSIMSNQKLGFRLGAFDYIQKPVQPEMLTAALERALARRARSILVVDDDPDARDLLCQVLKDENIGFQTAANGRQALERIQDSVPDLILLDLMMPEMDGFEVIRRLRQNANWAAIPVIVISAKTLSEDEKQFLAKQTDALLSKEGMHQDMLLKEIAATLKDLADKPKS